MKSKVVQLLAPAVGHGQLRTKRKTNTLLKCLHHDQGHDQGHDLGHDQGHDQGHDHDQGRVWAWDRDPAPLINPGLDQQHPCARQVCGLRRFFSGKKGV